MLDSKGGSSVANDSHGESGGYAPSAGGNYGGGNAAPRIDDMADDIPF